MAAIPPNQMMTCPYNPAHQVEHYRMHVHLQKCQKQHTNCKKVSCPFDATHIVKDVELDSHMATCPKRYLLDTCMYKTDDEVRAQPEYVAPPPAVPCDENWEEDVPTSYVPDLSKKGSHIITKIKGATPSERRKHRMESIKNYKAPQGGN